MAPKTPRKTQAEVKAEQYMYGFNACKAIMERHWRATISRGLGGISSDMKLFEIYQEMDMHAGLYDDDYIGAEHQQIRLD